MKQILQSLKSGETAITDVPCPAVQPGQLLIRTHKTLVSAGTERMLVDFGKAGWVNKARQQPDKVKQVLDKMKTDGVMPTVETVLNKLDQPLPLGYCNVGRVLEVGQGVTGFEVGDLVISNGKHAQVVSVPVNLCARVPEGISDETAAFTVLSAIALQGIRLVNPTLGETVVVTGLGLIGLVAVQLLIANGCRVLGLDFDKDRLAMARSFGAEALDLSSGADPVQAAERFSNGHGVDAVLITASTKSNAPVHQAANMCRKRGRIVLVGVTGLELSRADFYEKELSFQVSCSYGPGRYESDYEDKGLDYPIGFVRWTEQRNFEAILDLMAGGRLNVGQLISHRIPLDNVAEAYDLVSGSAPSLGIVLDYPDTEAVSDGTLRNPVVQLKASAPVAGKATLGFIGAGNYATGVLIPAFHATGARLKSVVSQNGLSGVHVGTKLGIEQTSTDVDAVMSDEDIDALVITTRHDSHADLVCSALAAGKHVFVEKPLALGHAELDAIENAYATAREQGAPRQLMVGFNRRFSPLIKKADELLMGEAGPKSFVMTVNAGAIPVDHWTQDMDVGGGRIIGEACHFIDLIRFLAKSPITSHSAAFMDSSRGDTAAITLGFEDGSIGTVHYLCNGDKAFPKERLEVFASGKILQLDNFRRLNGFGWPEFKTMKLTRQDKGQKACAAAFLSSVETGGEGAIGFAELMEISRVSVDIAGAGR
ncbi:MAG: Gfo/Idh/MocA family oxidoreductase [Gammaproteobacteria bacterium]|nr:Gfo/Idh/MocA family oxidoreductase [Gammaproteobacteria bacterium]